MRGIENVFLSMRESGEKAGDARSYYENVFEKVRETMQDYGLRGRFEVEKDERDVIGKRQ